MSKFTNPSEERTVPTPVAKIARLQNQLVRSGPMSVDALVQTLSTIKQCGDEYGKQLQGKPVNNSPEDMRLFQWLNGMTTDSVYRTESTELSKKQELTDSEKKRLKQLQYATQYSGSLNLPEEYVLKLVEKATEIKDRYNPLTIQNNRAHETGDDVWNEELTRELKEITALYEMLRKYY